MDRSEDSQRGETPRMGSFGPELAVATRSSMCSEAFEVDLFPLCLRDVPA